MANKRTKASSENILRFGRILPKNAKLTCRPLSRLEWYVARTVKTCKICIGISLVSRRNDWSQDQELKLNENLSGAEDG